MGKLVTMTLEVDMDLLSAFDRAVAHRGRDKVLAELLADYVGEAARFRAFMQEAEDQIDRGECAPQEEVEAIFAARRIATAAE